MSKELESEERMDIRRVLESLNEIRMISAQMSISQVMSFLTVALNEGKSLKELAELMDCKMNTMSRQLIDLGPRNRRMEEGYQLIQSRQDPFEYRKNQYTLTPRGRHLIKAILKHMGKP